MATEEIEGNANPNSCALFSPKPVAVSFFLLGYNDDNFIQRRKLCNFLDDLYKIIQKAVIKCLKNAKTVF